MAPRKQAPRKLRAAQGGGGGGGGGGSAAGVLRNLLEPPPSRVQAAQNQQLAQLMAQFQAQAAFDQGAAQAPQAGGAPQIALAPKSARDELAQQSAAAGLGGASVGKIGGISGVKTPGTIGQTFKTSTAQTQKGALEGKQQDPGMGGGGGDGTFEEKLALMGAQGLLAAVQQPPRGQPAPNTRKAGAVSGAFLGSKFAGGLGAIPGAAIGFFLGNKGKRDRIAQLNVSAAKKRKRREKLGRGIFKRALGIGDLGFLQSGKNSRPFG